MRASLHAAAVALAAAAWPAKGRAQEACIACHSKIEAKIEVMGQIRSVRIDMERFHASPHGDISCDTCHVQPAFTSYPHKLTVSVDTALARTNGVCSDCHPEVADQFNSSVHAGVLVCSRCHHPHDPYPEGVREHVQNVCVECHSSRYATYLDTYHGKATMLGRVDVAKCTDCHTAHHILPASDPDSTVSPSHRLRTCRLCHPLATRSFASFRVHADASSPRAPLILFLTSLTYRVLIFTVFGLGGLHALAYLWRGVHGGYYRRRKSRHG